MSTEAKIPEADLKNVNLKPTETVEKVILPSAEGKFPEVKVGEISPGNHLNNRLPGNTSIFGVSRGIFK